MVIKPDEEWTKWDDFCLELEHIFIEPFRKVYYWLKNVLVRRHHIIKTKLAMGYWYCVDTRMLYGMMNLLMDYLKDEKPLETINWDADEYHKHARDEMLVIRDWWLNFPNREKEINDALEKWHNAKFGETDHEDLDEWIDKMNQEDTPEVHDLHKALVMLEENLRNETEDMLIRLVRIREYLWT